MKKIYLKTPSILIIDDEQAIRDTLQAVLCDEGYAVTTLHNPSLTLQIIGELVPDLVLLDIFMPNVNGINLLESIKKEYPTQKVIMISGFGNISIALDTIKKGACDFIEKPLNLDEILHKLQFLKKEPSYSKTEEHSSVFSSHCLIGESYLFKEMLHSIEHLAVLDFPILIYGHHGTGKSTVAHYIHANSNYKQLPLSIIDCASITQEDLSLIIQKQEHGSLFLKNINYLSLPQQKILLFLLTTTKLRIIASSTQQLYLLQQQNAFLAPLFHKLNIVPLEIPPLSKRKHDIPLLVSHFLEKQNHKLSKKLEFSTASIRLLRNTNWQGNIKQLKQFIECIAATLEDFCCITPEELYPYLEERHLQFIEEQSFTAFNSLEEATNNFEEHFLLYHLKKSKFDLAQVSDKLHLKISQLRARIQELNIEIINQ